MLLVTGADGFIGSHVVEALARRGTPVRAFCLYNSFNSWGWLDHAEPTIRAAIDVRLGDVRDRSSVDDAMAGCDGVINLAALIAIPYSYRAVESFIDVNVTGALNILEAARRHGLRKIVQLSTSETYGSAQTTPMDETHPLSAQSPYAASKIAADQLALSYWRSFDTPVAIARPFNAYGPRQSLRAVIPTILTQLIDGVETLDLGALTPRRDFTFVSDTVSGLLALYDHDGALGDVVNIGSGEDHAIGDIARHCMHVVGREIPITQSEARLRPAASEVDRLLCDNAKARRLLGWSPAFSGVDGLRRGLSLFAEWLADPVNRAQYRNAERYVV